MMVSGGFNLNKNIHQTPSPKKGDKNNKIKNETQIPQAPVLIAFGFLKTASITECQYKCVSFCLRFFIGSNSESPLPTTRGLGRALLE